MGYRSFDQEYPTGRPQPIKFTFKYNYLLFIDPNSYISIIQIIYNVGGI